MGILGAFASALGFGTANIVIKKSLGSLTIRQTLFMSTVSGMICLFVLALISRLSFSLSVDVIAIGAALAVLEVALYIILYKAFSASHVTVATAVIGTYPIISTFISVLFLGEIFELTKFLFIILLVVGAIVTSINWNEVKKDGFDKQDLAKGLNWIIASTLIHALYFPLLGSFTSTGSWEVKLLIIKIFSSLILVLFFVIIQKQKVIPSQNKILFTSLLGLLEVIGWAGLAWASSATDTQTYIVIAVLNSSALVAAILAYIFLKEKLSTFQYLGVILIVAGLTGLAL